MSNDTQNNKLLKKTLKERFQTAQITLLAALNGRCETKVPDADISELRRNLIQARLACEKHGVEVETFQEFVVKQRNQDEAHVRNYAEKQLKVSPALSFGQRQRAAWATASALAVVVFLKWPTLGGMVSAAVAGCVTFALAEAVLAELLPTPPIRIARLASKLSVDVSYLWPEGSNELKDYVHGYLRHLRHLRRI